MAKTTNCPIDGCTWSDGAPEGEIAQAFSASEFRLHMLEDHTMFDLLATIARQETEIMHLRADRT